MFFVAIIDAFNFQIHCTEINVYVFVSLSQRVPIVTRLLQFFNDIVIILCLEMKPVIN